MQLSQQCLYPLKQRNGSFAFKSSSLAGQDKVALKKKKEKKNFASIVLVENLRSPLLLRYNSLLRASA